MRNFFFSLETDPWNNYFGENETVPLGPQGGANQINSGPEGILAGFDPLFLLVLAALFIAIITLTFWYRHLRTKRQGIVPNFQVKKYCPYCGLSLTDQAVFCTGCGQKID